MSVNWTTQTNGAILNSFEDFWTNPTLVWIYPRSKIAIKLLNLNCEEQYSSESVFTLETYPVELVCILQAFFRTNMSQSNGHTRIECLCVLFNLYLFLFFFATDSVWLMSEKGKFQIPITLLVCVHWSYGILEVKDSMMVKLVFGDIFYFNLLLMWSTPKMLILDKWEIYKGFSWASSFLRCIIIRVKLFKDDFLRALVTAIVLCMCQSCVCEWRNLASKS